MTDSCPSCGGKYQDDGSCQTVFDEFIAREFSDPAYGAVHFLTVSSYMIQHGQYSDQALVWIEKQLRNYFEKGFSADQIRLQADKDANQAKRNWKVTRRMDEPAQEKIAWSITILDVARHKRNAESYCAWVQRWARSTLNEMQPLLPGGSVS